MSDPKIPAKLLTRLLHHHFQNEKTKVAKDANTVVAKYVDVFVREAIARAAYERAETDSAGGGRRPADGFLEVGFYFMGGMLVGEMLIVCYRWKTLRKWRRSLRWISDGLRAIYVNECRYNDTKTERPWRWGQLILVLFCRHSVHSRHQIPCTTSTMSHHHQVIAP